MENLADIAQELSHILGKIQGVKGLNQTFSLSYLVVVEDEASKKNVQKVSEVLLKQANGLGIDLDILALTQKELDDAKNEYENSVSVPAAGLTAIKVKGN